MIFLCSSPNFFAVFFLSLFGMVLPSQASQILEIKTEGLNRIERSAVLEKISFKPGAELDPKKIADDIRALHGMGYFDAVDVVEGNTAGELIYRFKERPVISEVEFSGNEKIQTSDLQDVIKVKKWNIFDVAKVKEDVELLQKHYEDKGFLLAKISYETQALKPGEVKLIYKFDDYDKVEIRRITFLNNKVYTDEKLKSVFAETKEGASLNFLASSGTFKEASFNVDLQRLTYYYLENGYAKFKTEAPIITLSPDKRFVSISVYMEEGNQYTVGNTDFGGDLLFPKDELFQEIKMTEGQTFSVSARNADIQRLTEKYQDLGYAYANVIPKMDLNDETKTANTEYVFEKGSLVYFGEIKMIGNTKTYDKVIRRELRIHEGELFSGSKLRISKERVERLGFFAPNEVEFRQVPRKDQPDVLDLEIRVKERSTGSITLGAGYSSIQGFFFQGRIQEINLFGRGQNLGLDIQWGRLDIVRSFSIDFTDPYAFDTLWSLGGSLYMANAPLPFRYLTRRTGFQLRAGYPLTDVVQAMVTYKFEHMSILRDYTVNSTVGGGPNVVADPTLDKGSLSSLTFSLVRDVRNNRFETTDGNFQSVSLEVAGLGGQKNFTKLLGNNRVYTPLPLGFVFKNSTEVGGIFNTGSQGIPPAERFYLGGPWNMRGYEAFSLAPTLIRPNGVERLGGATQLFSLFEIEHSLIKEAGLKWVTFYDVGNAWLGMPGVDEPFDIRQNWGFGIRWFSPLGPLRFEWGFPVGRRVQPTTNRIEASPVFIFFIGQPF